jgi:hypothetical protein
VTHEEKLYWTGNAVFVTAGGAGLYVVFDHWFWGSVFIAVGLAGLAFSLWEGRAVGRSTVLFSTLVFTWGLIALDYYDRNRQGSFPPEFDSPGNVGLIVGYGMDTPNSCYGSVQGAQLTKIRSEYKLAIGCFLWDGTMDRLDAPNVQVSNLYDITASLVTARVTFGPGFEKYREEQHAAGILVSVFLVPNGVSVSQFTTLRQARSLGVHILSMSLAKTETFR